MNKDISTICFILLMAFLMIFCFDSCSQASNNYFEYADYDFEAEIEGQIDSMDVRAKVSYQADGEEHKVTVRFLHPSSLEGIVVTKQSNGQASARYQSITLDGEGYGKLAEPFLCLIHHGEYQSIEKDRDGISKITVSNKDRELVYAFSDAEIFPKYVEGQTDGRSVKFKINKAFFLQSNGNPS